MIAQRTARMIQREWSLTNIAVFARSTQPIKRPNRGEYYGKKGQIDT